MSNVPAPRRTIDRRIVGTPAEVAAQVAIVRDSGRLVAMKVPRQMPNGDTRVYADVTFLDRTEPAPPPAPRRRWGRGQVIVATSTLLTLLGVAAYTVVQLVNAVVAVFPYIVGGLLILAGIALLASVVGGRSRTFSGTFTGRMH